jgi:hypothetical protein
MLDLLLLIMHSFFWIIRGLDGRLSGLIIRSLTRPRPKDCGHEPASNMRSHARYSRGASMPRRGGNATDIALFSCLIAQSKTLMAQPLEHGSCQLQDPLKWLAILRPVSYFCVRFRSSRRHLFMSCLAFSPTFCILCTISKDYFLP